MENHVPLQRRFAPIPKNQNEADHDEALSFWGHQESKSWDDLNLEYRCVILAAAGTGKTEEFRHHAIVLSDQGKPTFFIKIEDIAANFYTAFEIGEEAQFQSWLQSTEEAWFFLDSVDEARLDNPSTFKKALRQFARTVKQGAHRAHIYISSRPYAWRPKEDGDFLDEILFKPASQEKCRDEGRKADPKSALTVYNMLPLDQQRIRRFCEARKASDIERLLLEIERCNLWSLAERPFDLEGILSKWAEDKVLGGRLQLLRHNIDQRLKDTHNTDRAQRQPLQLEQAKQGARRLAAAVVLSGQAGLNVPDASPHKPGIEAESVLADWKKPADVRALLERGIFNDIIYGAVRFRHREIRELLAAEWFDTLLKNGNSRHAVEALFFREQYGEQIIAPRLRPILPWLILFDDGIRQKALQILPEIAVESGDPSELPLAERQKILHQIVHRIVTAQDDRSARDNSAIARIAQADLAPDTLQLIHQYQNDDDAIFFLGRLVWQGEMASCLDPLLAIALDSSRGKYARIASARAVMTCGTAEQKQQFWLQLNQAGVIIPRDLLAEVVDWAEPDIRSVEQLLASLHELPPYDRFKVIRLQQSLHEFIARLPVDGNAQEINRLIEGLHAYLVTTPHIERGECRVSKQHAWLLSFAIHAVERLVEVRNSAALEEMAMFFMLMMPVLRFWGEGDFSEHESNLPTLVPSWAELNDALYWASIEQARLHKTATSNEPFTDDWPVFCIGHFCKFDPASFPRLLDYTQTRTLPDDKLIALNAAFRVYCQADKPDSMLTSLRQAVSYDSALQDRLDILLDPPDSEMSRQLEEMHAKNQQQRMEKEKLHRLARHQWIDDLRANPDRVCSTDNLKPGELTEDQYWLLRELRGEGLKTSRADGAEWQALIPDFGEAVAQAYRKAAMDYWRFYTPTLRSEVERDNSIPYSLIFALAGLEIEAAEIADFPRHLSESEVRHALRYITWELNGFPSWFERMHHAFPELSEEAVRKELIWELENTGSDQPMPYILSDLTYHAPWLHRSVAPVILAWTVAHPGRITTNQHYCLPILAKAEIPPELLAELANRELAVATDLENIARWHALRVDCDPDIGIAEFERWMLDLSEADAKKAAQLFITALLGSSFARDRGPYVGRFRTAEHLKSLYVLMHRYIRVSEDINRANGGSYSPELRDDAQDARNRLFGLLAEIPGKASYIAINQLIEDHPAPDYRPWMAKRAYQRAEQDGDLEPWTAEQVYTFSQLQTFTPVTHRQLFDLAVLRLQDLKDWLERGNDSAWKTWQHAAEETEMRTLVAGWLNQQCRNQYVTAQEPELANSQRMDIWLQNTNVRSPVPIELKLLDKGWSGPNLCERLRNQLVGDYLREQSAGCGVMLLVAQKLAPNKRWRINGRNVVLNDLADSLKDYWLSIAAGYPGIEAIDVIVIDLAQRGHVSNS